MEEIYDWNHLEAYDWPQIRRRFYTQSFRAEMRRHFGEERGYTLETFNKLMSPKSVCQTIFWFFEETGRLDELKEFRKKKTPYGVYARIQSALDKCNARIDSLEDRLQMLLELCEANHKLLREKNLSKGIKTK